MTAEGDGFALLLAAEGIAAIRCIEIHQREMTRHDLDAAEPWRLHALESRRLPLEFRRMLLARFAKPRLLRPGGQFGPMPEVIRGPVGP
jgi:hypothetical protein